MIAAALLILALVAAILPAALAGSVTVNSPLKPWAAGTDETLTWSYDAAGKGPDADAPVKVMLMRVNGDLNNMVPMTELGTTTPSAGSLKFKVPTNLPESGDYAVQFAVGTDPAGWKYTGVFAVTGGKPDLQQLSGTSTTGSTSGTATATTTGTSTATETSTHASETTHASTTTIGSTTSSATSTATTTTAAPRVTSTLTNTNGAAGSAPSFVLAAVVAAAGFLAL
ncbi:hypothetical protein AMAG_12021 [Allomyces macrogynus ATCC 38327]|uniref:Yeast cell wall synthesis Kre9/Knh1-like N-terminal domain-containing protein n=1 Tax=Allomyces macrogynus (strain ATCC 38327) TaxID=578462 RepID=A0A0L0SZ36_ALLM3|nr:hypothetical protein AMAG_12021 [Allomyces macrogynus ATCC 38327]|eukprot:KNE67569.1 hypothetical protein AMAG_12021 [Allomyces macrogynus ATCC 38327]